MAATAAEEDRPFVWTPKEQYDENSPRRLPPKRKFAKKEVAELKPEQRRILVQKANAEKMAEKVAEDAKKNAVKQKKYRERLKEKKKKKKGEEETAADTTAATAANNNNTVLAAEDEANEEPTESTESLLADALASSASRYDPKTAALITASYHITRNALNQTAQYAAAGAAAGAGPSIVELNRETLAQLT